jgi:PAS domain-containing protein
VPARAYTPAAVWLFNGTYFLMGAGVLTLASRQMTSASDRAQRERAGRRQAEADLGESEERFRRLADASYEGIVFTEGGVVPDANQQVAQMLGY